MRQFNLKNYDIEGLDGKREKVTVPYNVRDTLVNILFNPELRLGAKDLLSRDDLSRKILGCQEDTVLLEESEYQQILNAVNSIKGYGKSDIEFVKRVLECPQVQVETKE